MASEKITLSRNAWLYHYFVAMPLTFLFVTHRKTTMCALIVALTIFSLAICFPPFLPALITFKIISFAPFAFMAAMSLKYAALTAAGLAASTTVLAIKALYLAGQAITVALPRFYHYLYPPASPPAVTTPPIMETYTVQNLFVKFTKEAQVGRVFKIKKNGEIEPIDGSRLSLSPKIDSDKQRVVQIPATATAIEWLTVINQNDCDILKAPKPKPNNALPAIFLKCLGIFKDPKPQGVGHKLSADKLFVNATP